MEPDHRKKATLLDRQYSFSYGITRQSTYG